MLTRARHSFFDADISTGAMMGLQDVFNGMLYKTLKQAGYFADDDYS
jgi:hypothetical protein